MVFAAVALAIGGVLFEMIGPGMMHSLMGLASAAFVPLLWCIDHDPDPKVAEQEQDEDDDNEAARKKTAP
jgi:hypothetical protein